jgi:DNA-binding response OmpR family regulator
MGIYLRESGSLVEDKKLLIIDVNQELAESLKSAFEKDGYMVMTAFSGSIGLGLARSEKPDIVILDIELTDINGLDVCRILHREFGMPMLVLSAKNTEIDKVLAIELGADDYVTMPFSMRELVLRVHSILNRSQEPTPHSIPNPPNRPGVVKIDDIELDFVRHRFSRKGKEVYLTPREFELLSFMMKNHGTVFSRDKLLDKVWGFENATGIRTVDYLIFSLRSKIEDNPRKPRKILSVRGVGYRLG